MLHNKNFNQSYDIPMVDHFDNTLEVKPNLLAWLAVAASKLTMISSMISPPMLISISPIEEGLVSFLLRPTRLSTDSEG